ncbi:hypothetical protein JCM3765_003592 [Sporobolomyces pararoseus]
MPFVQLPNEPTVELYYEFYEPFDPKKPTTLFLPPAISCSALIVQYVLPRLPEITRQFNCLALDLRCHGRTKNEAGQGMDCFVFAADIAFVLNTLKIPSVHLVANSYVAGPTAFAFSLLFPSSILSLSILGASPLNSMPSQLPALMELLEGWLQGEDEEWLFDSMTAILDLSFSGTSKDYRDEELELLDWLSNMWFRRIGPHRALRTFGVTAPILLSPGISKEELATIKCPVLIVQGTEDMMRGIPFAEEIRDGLTGTEDVSLEIVEGGVCYVGIANLEEVRPLLTNFLESQISLTSEATSITFPSPPAPASTSNDSPTDTLTSFAYSRYDHEEPLCQQLWQLCNQLDGKCLVTFADREPEVGEEGGNLSDVGKCKWRFSQRHRNERATSSRRGSVPQIQHDEATTVVTVEEVPLPLPPLDPDLVKVLDTTPTDNVRGFESWTGFRSRREDDNLEKPTTTATAQFRMDTWQWESTNSKPLTTSH